MTLENNRAHLLYYIKLCASFQIHRWNQSCVTVRKLLIRVNIDFLSCVTLKFNGWHWKTKGHLYTTLSFVHHFKAMGEFKLELQFGTLNSGQNQHFLSRVTLKFDRWPWKTIGYLSYTASGFVHHFIAIGEFKLESQSGNTQFGSKSTFVLPCDLEIWRMTLRNDRAPLLINIKLCVSLYPRPTKLEGGYTGFTLSVRLSVCPSVCL